MSISTAKPKGISKDDYEKFQGVKAETDFQALTNQRLTAIHWAIDEIKKRMSVMSGEFNSLQVASKTIMNESICSTTSSISDFRQMIGDYKSQIDLINEVIGSIKKLLDGCVQKSQMQDFHKEISAPINDVRERLESFKLSVQQMFQHQSNNMESKMKVWKEEVYNIPEAFPYIQQSLEEKMKASEINSQNAHFRSSNNEKKIVSLQRQYENLELRIKSLELDKQV